MNTITDVKTIYIDNSSNECVQEVLKEYNEIVDFLDKNHPEWRDYSSYVEVCDDEEDSFISIIYSRYLTKEEQKENDRKVETYRNNALNALWTMINQYPEEAREFVKQLG